MWQPRVAAADRVAAAQSSLVLAALPLRRLYCVFMPRNLLLNSLLLSSQQTSDDYGALSPSRPWLVGTFCATFIRGNRMGNISVLEFHRRHVPQRLAQA